MSTKELKINPQQQEDEEIRIDIEGVMGNTPFKISGNLSKLAHALRPELNSSVYLTIETAGTSLNIEGTVKDLKKMTGLDLNFVLTGQNPDELADMFGKSLPPIKPFTLKGNLKDSRPLYYELSELHFAMEKSEVRGSCSIDLSGKKPRITADFLSSYIDFRKLFSIDQNLPESVNHQNDLDTHEQNTTDNVKVFSQKPFNMAPLKAFDLNLELSAEKLFLPHVALNNCHVKTSVKGGSFSVDSLTGNIGGGRLVSSLGIEPSDQTVSVLAFLNIDQMNLEQMLQDMGLDIEGKGLIDVELSLNSQGKSMAELMAGLTGDAGLIMGEGRIDRNYLDFLGFFKVTLFSSLMKILNIPTGPDKSKNISDTNCFVIHFDVTEGLANLTAMVLDTRQTTFVGSGKIDLAGEKLDISLRPIPKEGIGREGLIRFDISLSELTRVLYLSGTLANPNVAIDTTQTFVTLGKAIGGVVLFGPAGIAAALLTGKIGKDSPNLCMEAIEAAREGVEIEKDKTGIFNFIGDFFKRINPLN
ncbi:MAG: AsmA family protein [Desulfobacterales bacterium]